MSTIEQADVIDFLAIDHSGSINLIIVDPLDWSDVHAHIFALQKKLERYADFVESGEVFSRAQEKAGRDIPRETPVKLIIVGRFPLTAEAQAFLKYAQGIVSKAGFQLHHEVKP